MQHETSEDVSKPTVQNLISSLDISCLSSTVAYGCVKCGMTDKTTNMVTYRVLLSLNHGQESTCALETAQVSLRSINNQGHFTWRPRCILGSISVAIGVIFLKLNSS